MLSSSVLHLYYMSSVLLPEQLENSKLAVTGRLYYQLDERGRVLSKNLLSPMTDATQCRRATLFKKIRLLYWKQISAFYWELGAQPEVLCRQ